MRRLLCALLGHRWRFHRVLVPRDPRFGRYQDTAISYYSCDRCGGVS